MDIAALVLGFLSIFMVVYTYFKHDKKINAQQEKLNEQQTLINNFIIDQKEIDIENNKKADFKVYIYENKIVFENIGHSEASNIKVNGTEALIIESTPFPSNIDKGTKKTINFIKSNNSKGVHNLEIIWDDKFKKGRYKEVSIQI